jgi:hypothetical protein
MAIISLTEHNLETGAKVSWKSIPGNWAKPFATNFAFRRAIVPSELNFVFRTHLQPIIFRSLGRSTISHVLFFFRELNSFFIASLHSSDSCRKNASLIVLDLLQSFHLFLNLLSLLFILHMLVRIIS